MVPEEGLTAWDRETQTGVLRNLVVREGRRTGQLQARVVTSPGGEFRVPELAAATPVDSFSGRAPRAWPRPPEAGRPS